MRNVFLIIRRYFNFLFFLVMQVIAIYMLVHYNKFHEAAFMGISNEVTGRFDEKYNNIETYFKLKETNDALRLENTMLRNQLRQDYQAPDTSNHVITDTTVRDTLGQFRKYIFRSAEVVNNYVNFPDNYITIHRGEKQGIRKDMGVLSPSGVAGSVIYTSENLVVVMSLLHSQSKTSVKLKKNNEFGQVFWDGKDPRYVTMINLPKSMPVNKGDSIVTSQYSRFPEGILVGTVAEVVDDKSSNFYTLKLKTATNFYSLEFVNVVENLQKDEQKKLEESIKNQ